MKAILTRSLSWTNTKPCRIKASAEACPARTYSRDSLADELNLAGLASSAEAIHKLAARKYRVERGWGGSLATGELPNGDHVHCFIERAYPSQYHVGLIVDRVWGAGNSISREDAVTLGNLSVFKQGLFEAALRYVNVWDTCPHGYEKFPAWWKKNSREILAGLSR